MRAITTRQQYIGKFYNSKERYISCNLSNGEITMQFDVADKDGKIVETIEFPVKALKTKPYFVGWDDQKHYLKATEIKTMNQMLADQHRMSWNGLMQDVSKAFTR